MAYVPGFEYDLFLSYAHGDDPAWIESFQESLRQALSERLGWEMNCWRDANSLRAGQNWGQEIQDGIRDAASFLAILSPSYRNSDWCGRERRFFREAFPGPTAEAGGISRFIKVVKTPWPNDSHLQFHPEYQQLAFFLRKPGSSDWEGFIPGSREFREVVNKLAHAMEELLSAMRRNRERVFIASTPDDLRDERLALAHQLLESGYDVRPEGVLDEGFSDEYIRGEMDHAVLAVHLLGPVYDPFVERQVSLSIETERELLFWVMPGALDKAAAQQRALIDRVRMGKGIPDNFTLLEDMQPRSMINEVLHRLKPAEPAGAGLDGSGRSRVYLLYDKSSPGDSRFAEQLGAQIEGQGMEVLLPASGMAENPADRHQKLLRACDGVLLYQDAAPGQWLHPHILDVMLAEARYGRPPMKSKGFLLTDIGPVAGVSDVQVFGWRDPFQIAELEPFLAPLREKGTGHAG